MSNSSGILVTCDWPSITLTPSAELLSPHNGSLKHRYRHMHICRAVHIPQTGVPLIVSTTSEVCPLVIDTIVLSNDCSNNENLLAPQCEISTFENQLPQILG